MAITQNKAKTAKDLNQETELPDPDVIIDNSRLLPILSEDIEDQLKDFHAMAIEEFQRYMARTVSDLDIKQFPENIMDASLREAANDEN